MMKVFISWSGDTSKAVAEILCAWIKTVLQPVRPWISTEIDKGTVWVKQIEDGLRDTHHGIVCVTPDNLDSRWLHFEAGAVWKATDENRVNTFLFGVDGRSDLEWPLFMFQATRAEKDDTLKMLKSINKEIPKDSRLDETTLVTSFERGWPELERKLAEIDLSPATDDEATGPSDRALLEAIHDTSKRIEGAQLTIRQDLIDRGAVKARWTDIYPQPFGNQSCQSLLDHISDPRRALAELQRQADAPRREMEAAMRMLALGVDPQQPASSGPSDADGEGALSADAIAIEEPESTGDE